MNTPPPLPLVMPGLSFGFFLGSEYPWGTTYPQVQRAFQFAGIVEKDLMYRSFCSVPIEFAYGLKICSACFASNHRQSPIMDVSYELQDVGSEPENPAQFVEKVAKYFGSPILSGPTPEPPLPRYGAEMRKFDPFFSARWQEGEMVGHLSLRRVSKSVFGGRSIGTLKLLWKDNISAAAPYLPDLLKKERELSQWLPLMEKVAKITLEADQGRYAHSTDPARPFNPTSVKSWICLRKTGILETPDSISKGLSAADVLVWRDSNASPKSCRWGISSKNDTLVFDRSGAQLELVELLPAKGRGSSHLRIGHLSFRGPPRSPQIAALGAVLRAMPGVLVKTIEEHDC